MLTVEKFSLFLPNNVGIQNVFISSLSIKVGHDFNNFRYLYREKLTLDFRYGGMIDDIVYIGSNKQSGISTQV